MIRSKLSSKVMLLVGGIGLSIAAFAGSQPAAAQSYSNEYACPVGTMYDPTYGCTTESTDDFGYYGYPGFAGRGKLPIRCPMLGSQCSTKPMAEKARQSKLRQAEGRCS